MWEWIDDANQLLPEVLKLARPDDPQFIQKINQRPWSDPIPALFILYPLVGLLVAGLSFGVGALIKKTKKSL